MANVNDPKYRGYRYGVRHCDVGEEGLTLLEFVDQGLTRERRQLSDRPVEPIAGSSAELSGERPGELWLFSAGDALTALELIELGAVYVNDNRSLLTSLSLKLNDRVRIHTRPRRYPQPASLIERIAFENDEVLIVDKPAGLPVHALVDNAVENLISYLENVRGGPLFITHRLDVETSGLVLLAKNPAAQSRLNRAFAVGAVKRTYAAYVDAPVALGRHTHFMEPTPNAPKNVSSIGHVGWARCELDVKACENRSGETSLITEGRTTWNVQAGSIANLYRLEISLQTGRPQQIRAQLTALGHPILGDKSYGSTVQLVDSENQKAAVALRAVRLVFD